MGTLPNEGRPPVFYRGHPSRPIRSCTVSPAFSGGRGAAVSGPLRLHTKRSTQFMPQEKINPWVIALRILRAEDVRSIPHGEKLVKLLHLK